MVDTIIPRSETLATGSWYSPPLEENGGPLVAATDGSTAGEAAVRAASLIAEKISADVDVLRVDERHGRPSRAIVDHAEAKKAQLIILGHVHHAMLDRLLDRETALEVVRRSSIPVLLASANMKTVVKRALLAVDFSPESREAARDALTLLDGEAFVVLAHVAPSPTVFEGSGLREDEYETMMEVELRKFARALSFPPRSRVEHVILHGRPAHALLRLAERTHADLIAIGTRGADKIQRLFVGSNTARIIHNSRCSVLIAPCREGDTARTIE